MRILITGLTGLGNRGVEALLVATVEGLAACFPGAEFLVSTWSPEADRRRYAVAGVKWWHDPWPGAVTPRWRSRVARTVRSIAGGRQLALDERWPGKKIDLVVASGGDVFGSEYGTQSLEFHLAPLYGAMVRNVPFVMLGHSIGPFRKTSDAEMWKQVAQYAKLITVREPLSYRYVTDTLGLPSRVVHQTADVAFLLPADAVMLERCNDIINNGDPRGVVVGIAPSESISRWSGGDDNLHLSALSDLIRMVLDSWKAHVLLVPHVQEWFSDDRSIATELWRRLGFDPRVHLAAGDHSASEYKALLSQCELIIAERMHAAIAGLSSGVCTVAIQYSVKARGIVASLVGEELAEAGCVVPYEDFIDVRKTSLRLRHVWDQRQVIRSRIKEALPATLASASWNWELARQVLAASPRAMG